MMVKKTTELPGPGASHHIPPFWLWTVRPVGTLNTRVALV